MTVQWKAFHAVTTGASHLDAGKICQDSAASAASGNLVYAVVCDGHGGSDYFRSDKGSRFAAEAFAKAVQDEVFLSALCKAPDENSCQQVLNGFVRSLIACWKEKVDQDIREFPFCEEEFSGVSEDMREYYEAGRWRRTAYGTTLVGFAVTDDFCFGVQIGDGKCVVLSDEGLFTQPIPWDSACRRNITTSLCDPEAYSKFRMFYSRSLPAAVFVGTDGIDKSFDDNKMLYRFYKSFVEAIDCRQPSKTVQLLAEYLPRLSREGSHDDMAVGILLCPRKIEKMKQNAAKNA